MPTATAEILLLFPHQLYGEHAALQAGRPVALLEENLYFTQFHFHQQKLVLHRASMRAYQRRLEGQGIACEYVEARQATADVRPTVRGSPQRAASRPGQVGHLREERLLPAGQIFFEFGLLDRIGMRADRAGRYPGHIKPLEQVVHTIQAIPYGELLGQQLADIFATDPSTATAVL